MQYIIHYFQLILNYRSFQSYDCVIIIVQFIGKLQRPFAMAQLPDQIIQELRKSFNRVILTTFKHYPIPSYRLWLTDYYRKSINSG